MTCIAPKPIATINQFLSRHYTHYISKIYETVGDTMSHLLLLRRLMAFPYSYDEINFRLKLSVKRKKKRSIFN